VKANFFLTIQILQRKRDCEINTRGKLISRLIIIKERVREKKSEKKGGLYNEDSLIFKETFQGKRFGVTITKLSLVSFRQGPPIHLSIKKREEQNSGVRG